MNLQISNVSSMKTMNISISAMARQQDVKMRQHLDGITLPGINPNGEVNLVIGADVPEALQQEEEVWKSDGAGPYAIKTVFGLTLNGPIGVSFKQGNHCFISNSVSTDDRPCDQLKR